MLPFVIKASLDVLMMQLTELAGSTIVCTFAVFDVTDTTFPTSPLSAITVILGCTPSSEPTFITTIPV